MSDTPAAVPLTLRRRVGLMADCLGLRRRPAPWAPGYWAYRNAYIAHLLTDSAAMGLFRRPQRLPLGFGTGLDERVVEYPWVMARLRRGPGWLLDAGSTLAVPSILRRVQGAFERMVVFTLALEESVAAPGVHYTLGDVRSMPFADGAFSQVTCISTLEHVGLDNTRYTQGRSHREAETQDFVAALAEMRRVLRPGGDLLLTVPYGRYQNLGWLQQFDRDLLTRATDAFAGETVELAFYRYGRGGWQLADASQCSACAYQEVAPGGVVARDGAAAARAVALVHLRRTEP